MGAIVHRFAAIIIASVAISALAGCGSDSQKNGPVKTTSSTTVDRSTATASPTSTTNTSGTQFEVGDTINYGSMDTTETVDCANGKSLNVGGSNNTLTVTGVCKDVTVLGSGNTITLNQVDSAINVVGIDNKLTYKAGDPRIDKFGDSNEVTKG
jgi:hypothetical protein